MTATEKHEGEAMRSGICDTCQRNQVCRRPMDGMDSCRLYVSGRESNYEKLFGTPERAARTIVAVHDVCDFGKPCYPNCPFDNAPICPSNCESRDYDTLLEWLRGEE